MSDLRIISGEGRGRYLKTYDDPSVRPILARIKKSLFDILKIKLADSRFLDLFAGTGAVGIEALSRGAGKSVFVDSSRRNTALITDNLKNLGWLDRAKVNLADITKGLEWLSEPFDLIFMGPPYKDSEKKPLSLTTPVLALIVRAKLLAKDGWIVSQHHDKEPVNIPPGLIRFRQEKYGDTILDFYKNA